MQMKIRHAVALSCAFCALLLAGCGTASVASGRVSAAACRVPTLAPLSAKETTTDIDAEKDALFACKGKTAGEAYKVAKNTSYEPDFEDSFGVDVTGDVRAGSDASKATVTKVDILDEGWFWDASVTFTLDYVDSAAKAERDNKEALLQKLNDLKGKTAAEAYDTAKGTEYTPSFEDSFGVDVTDSVSAGGDAAKAEVSKVDVTEKGWLWDASVTFTLDYVDPTAQAERDDKAAKKEGLESCEGLTAAEAYKFAKSTDYEPRFEDPYGVNVTSDVKAGVEAASAKVIEVKIKEEGWFSSASVTFTLEYVDPTAKAKRDEKQAADKKKEVEKTALNSCEGMTAGEAYKIGRGTSYELRFEDTYGVNVTDDVKSGGAAASAMVTEVRLSSLWLLGDSAYFTLDYVGPDAQKSREEEAAKQEAAKEKADDGAAGTEAEQKAETDKAAGKSDWYGSLVGRPLTEVLDEADLKGVGYTIVILPAGTDVTETLTREDLENRGLVVKEASRVGYVSPYSDSKQKKGDVELRVVDPEYWEDEKKLEETLPAYNAEKAVKDYAKTLGAKSVDPWYREAYGEDTWYIKGYMKVNGTSYTFEAMVSGTKATPIVMDFQYY